MSMSQSNHQGGFIMFIKASEKGQALILITLAAIGLFGFAALAIDSSRAYSNKRHAQNAADTAALAGALSFARQGNTNNVQSVALARAASNGYANVSGDTSTVVTVTVTDVPEADEEEYCPGDANGKDITVTIESYLNATFARILGRQLLASGATATARACGFILAPMFDGNAIVGLKPVGGSCAIDTGNSNSKSWITRGGGVFSNGCLEHPNGTLTIPNDKCITTVGNANTSGGGTHNCVQENMGAAVAYAYPSGSKLAAITPPSPCTGTPVAGRYPGGGKVPTSAQLTNDPAVFENDVFCITNFDALDDKHIALTNATLYVTDTSFDMRFNGGGDSGFFGTASNSGVYKGYYLIIQQLATKSAADACQQYFDFRGNGNLGMTGTIFAPSTCVDYRGNSTGTSVHSQMIFYRFTGNGNSAIDVTYDANENHLIPISPCLSILE
jgi:Flp pilus assembly protein TadG